MSTEPDNIKPGPSTEPEDVKPDRLLPTLLLGVPFIGAIVAHLAFEVSLEAIGLIALVFLVIGGVYYLFWKPGERGPEQLAAVFIIGEALGIATLGMAIVKLLLHSQ